MSRSWEHIRLAPGLSGRTTWEKGRTHHPSWTPTLKNHDLWFIRSGEGSLSTPDGDVPLSAGACLWLRPNRAYEATNNPDNPVSLYFLHFDLIDTRTGRTLMKPPFPSEALTVRDPIFIESVARYYSGQFWWERPMPPADDPAALAAAVMLKAALMDLEAATLSHPLGGKVKPIHSLLRITPSIDRMLEAPHEIRSLAEEARRAGCSVNHFTRLFRQATGLAPRELLIRRRIERACRLLRTSDVSIKELAADLGYRDSNFFVRQFRSIMATTPAAYRANKTPPKIRA